VYLARNGLRWRSMPRCFPSMRGDGLSAPALAGRRGVAYGKVWWTSPDPPQKDRAAAGFRLIAPAGSSAWPPVSNGRRCCYRWPYVVHGTFLWLRLFR
jgi:hypothetical protein